MSLEDNAEQLLNLLYASENPVMTSPTLVSGTAQQDATGVWSTWIIAITGGSAGTVGVKIGPDNTTADIIVPVVAANAVASQQLSVPLPPNWWIKVTATTASIAGATVLSGS